jgi:hypothetical protein
MAKKKRAINTGSQSIPAQARRELYGNAITRITNAIEHRFPLEAIALLESMMADRLEARLACIHKQDPEKLNFSTLGKLTQDLSCTKSAESDEAKAVYTKVAAWAVRRNEALHQMVKLAEGKEAEWATKVREAQETAETGLLLFRELDTLVKKLNKPPRRTLAKNKPGTNHAT